jgi:hypothetical protein
MIQRIVSLSLYLFRSLVLSLAGLLYLLLTFVFYMVFFQPGQSTPDADYYTLLIGGFGLVTSFLVTLSVASRANKAFHFPLLVRLPSRVEYLTSVFLASIIFVELLQALVALLALLVGKPELSLGQAIEIPPLWIAGNILFIVISLHASDFVAAGWSRVYIFGALAILLYVQSGLGIVGEWLSGLLNRLGNAFLAQGFEVIATPAFSLSSWLAGSGSEELASLFGLVFWPFRAIAGATIEGYFTLTQALAPAILLLYATVLFALAANLFAKKDLQLAE